MISLEDRVRGYIFGSAIGDAFGRAVEFDSYKQILSKYGENGIVDLITDDWTDDTQMMLAIGNALLKTHDKNETAILDSIAENFIKWMDDPGYAPGSTCMSGCANLKSGIHWSKSGIPWSKGCGSVMRSGVIGFFFRNDMDKLKSIASKSGLMTHAHPTADAACIAGALSINYALKGLKTPQIYEKVRSETLGISQEFTDKIDQMARIAQSQTPNREGIISLGQGWVADEAYAMALYSLWRTNNYQDLVVLASNHDGDSDSVACIAGGIFGAMNGISSIPQEWIDRLVKKNILANFADMVIEAIKQ